MTYLELITDAYRLRNVLDTTQAPDAELGTAALRLLNSLMAELLADGVELQYTPIAYSEVANVLGIPDYALGGITANLSTRVVAGGALTPEVQKQLDDGMATILRKAVNAKLQPPNMRHIPAGDADRGRLGDFLNG